MSMEGSAMTEYASLSGKIHSLVIDKSLSISGAAADSKAVGDAIYNFDRDVEEAKECYETARAEIEETFATTMDAVSKNLAGYTKEESISADTKTLFGLPDDAVPDDAMAFLGKYNQHWWKVARYELTQGNKTDFSISSLSSSTSKTLYYSDKCVLRQDGVVELVSPESTTVSVDNSVNAAALELVKGKYGRVEGDQEVWFIPLDATVFTGSNYMSFNTAYSIVGTDIQTEYAVSTDRNAYGGYDVDNNIRYDYMGKPLENAVYANKPRIGFVSYTGVYSYGENCPCVLNFPVAPKIVIYLGYTLNGYWYSNLANTSKANYCYFIQAVDLMPTEFTGGFGFGSRLNSTPVGKRSADGKTIEWYQTEGAEYQLTIRDYIYHFAYLY